MHPNPDNPADVPPAPAEGPGRSGEVPSWVFEVPPLLKQSQRAYLRDLPELLKTHYGKWVAYHGDERLGFGRTETELYQKGFRMGLTEFDFVVLRVEPLHPDEIFD